METELIGGPPSDLQPNGRLEPESRILVCESPECNPNLREYDAAMARNNPMDVGKRLSGVLREMGRELNHTVHNTTDRAYRFIHGSWMRGWVCNECGHNRYH